MAIVAQNLYVLLRVHTFTQLPETPLSHALCAREVDEQLEREVCTPQQREVRQVGCDAVLGLLRGKNEHQRLCDEVVFVECEVDGVWVGEQDANEDTRRRDELARHMGPRQTRGVVPLKEKAGNEPGGLRLRLRLQVAKDDRKGARPTGVRPICRHLYRENREMSFPVRERGCGDPRTHSRGV